MPSFYDEGTICFELCDAAAAARDARRMVDVGFNLGEVKVLDLFPQTSHLEVVSTYIR